MVLIVRKPFEVMHIELLLRNFCREEAFARFVEAAWPSG